GAMSYHDGGFEKRMSAGFLGDWDAVVPSLFAIGFVTFSYFQGSLSLKGFLISAGIFLVIIANNKLAQRKVSSYIVPIKFSPSLLAWFIYFRSDMGMPRLVEVMAIIFFMFVLTHEYAHIWVAQKYGIKTDYIDFNALGGGANLNHLSSLRFTVDQSISPAYKGKVFMAFSAAGPLMTVSLAVLSAVLNNVFALGMPSLFTWLLLAVGLGNVYPMIPLDGSKIMLGYFLKKYPDAYAEYSDVNGTHKIYYYTDEAWMFANIMMLKVSLKAGVFMFMAGISDLLIFHLLSQWINPWILIIFGAYGIIVSAYSLKASKGFTIKFEWPLSEDSSKKNDGGDAGFLARPDDSWEVVKAVSYSDMLRGDIVRLGLKDTKDIFTTSQLSALFGGITEETEAEFVSFDADSQEITVKINGSTVSIEARFVGGMERRVSGSADEYRAREFTRIIFDENDGLGMVYGKEYLSMLRGQIFSKYQTSEVEILALTVDILELLFKDINFDSRIPDGFDSKNARFEILSNVFMFLDKNLDVKFEMSSEDGMPLAFPMHMPVVEITPADILSSLADFIISMLEPEKIDNLEQFMRSQPDQIASFFILGTYVELSKHLADGGYGRIIVIPVAHGTEHDFERIRSVLDRLYARSRKENRNFILVTERGGPQKAVVQKYIAGRRNKDSHSIDLFAPEFRDETRFIFDRMEETMRMQERFPGLGSAGRSVNKTAVDFMNTQLLWTGEKTVPVFAEEARYREWMMALKALDTLNYSRAIILEGKIDDYLTNMDLAVDYMAKGVQLRDKHLRQQLASLAVSGTDVVTARGMVHYQGFQGFSGNYFTTSLEGEILPLKLFPPFEELITRKVAGEIIGGRQKREYFLRDFAFDLLLIILAVAGNDKVARENVLAQKIIRPLVDRLDEDTILASIDALKQKEALGVRYYLDWIKTHGNATEKMLFNK
ncbi:MAG: hypothetical protein PHE58_07800, partial [Candidatus Omnitrophica bacterium]|nr:hypothetical protein [Candidatus Omnitrophota bacterium]